LEILERIKHFFSVPNVHFVLGVHLGQLRNSVVVAYGPQIDAQTYLQKFIQVTLHLIDPERHPHERTVTKFVEYLEKVMEFVPEDRETVSLTTDLIRQISQHHSLSLRTIERIMSTLALAVAYTSRNTLRLPPILAGLCILKVTEPELYEKAKRRKLKYADIKEPLALGGTWDDDRLFEWFVEFWRFCSDDDLDKDSIQRLSRSLTMYTIRDRFDIVPFTANDIIDRLSLR
jgi:hypothetical protein